MNDFENKELGNRGSRGLFMPPPSATRAIGSKISEEELINIHCMFLTKGFQHIKAPDMAYGREIIEGFLKHAKFYRDVGAMTVRRGPLPNFVRDIVSELVSYGYVGKEGNKFLDQFFLDACYFDFMWIEETKELRRLGWYNQFKIKLLEFEVPSRIPVVLIS